MCGVLEPRKAIFQKLKGWWMHVEIPGQAEQWHHDCGALRRRDMLRMAQELLNKWFRAKVKISPSRVPSLTKVSSIRIGNPPDLEVVSVLVVNGDESEKVGFTAPQKRNDKSWDYLTRNRWTENRILLFRKELMFQPRSRSAA